MIDKKKVKRLYNSGVPVAEMSKEFGVSREAIYQKLRRFDDWEDMKRRHTQIRASKRLTELQERSPEIVSMWKKGATMLQIAWEFKTTRKNISTIIKNTLGTTKRRYERDAEIVQAYKNGVTQVELAKRYNISQPCVSRIIKTDKINQQQPL